MSPSLAERRSDSHDLYPSEPRRAHGLFWRGRIMNHHSPEKPVFSMRPMPSPVPAPSNAMPCEEPAADSQQASPSSPTKPLPLHSDYMDKVFYKFHQHNISDSTASGSNDSSPTTTVSTVDDSSATEPSPGSSPESPPPATFEGSMLRPRTSDEAKGAFFELQKQPPARKGRNLKNLAVDTSRQSGRAASTTSLPLSLKPIHADTMPSIASPAFVKPPSPPKRKPSNLGLTLLTPATNKAMPAEMRLAIPPTPAFSRPSTLRHFQSSPSLPVLPDFASANGAYSSSNRLAALETIFSPVEQPKVTLSIQEEEQNYDVPLSREEKPEAYPDGPICVYPPYVDLYLEPSAEQCRQYDVIMNVASEVLNPMAEHVDGSGQEPEIRIDGGGGIQFAPRRTQAIPLGAHELSVVSECSPTTPKATPLRSTFPADPNATAPREPEYIHIPWEHNSDIVPDLLRLCKQIDAHVAQSRRILVHCQCGVSRSASLVVAYGLYKTPALSVQEAYDAVKARSKWIGPNMNLIMQLQEFRTSLARGGLLPGNRGMTPITPSSAMSEWRGPFSVLPSDGLRGCVPLSAGVAEMGQQGSGGEAVSALTPGPSSAPSGLKWPVGDAIPPVQRRLGRAVSSSKRASAYVDPSGHVIPVLQIVGADAAPTEAQAQAPQRIAAESRPEDSGSATPTEPLASPRSAEFAMLPLRPTTDVEAADAFGIMSPTATQFPPSFDRPALLASLGMGSMTSDDTPRRALSLRARPKPAAERTPVGLAPVPEQRRLRGKISSPSLREQRSLRSLQVDIEARLCLSNGGAPSPGFAGGPDEAPMSPRATEFTKNPFALSVTSPGSPARDKEEEAEAPLSPVADVDPRSPALAGGSPITRSILDVL
ncbi:tyrosine/serine/threonine protein phosphatase [Teratosphaeriaceae sp. CCFEE 6253]|nr:tyrosine/serine/threonine protein phosphatase [Teratosphaeriaceae sp. CCFEE 6253]